MREKQVMKSSHNHPFNFFHGAGEMPEISLAWAIRGGRESPCEDVWINFWKHGAEQINVTTGAFSGFSEPPSIKSSVTILAQSDNFHAMGILFFFASILRFRSALRCGDLDLLVYEG